MLTENEIASEGLCYAIDFNMFSLLCDKDPHEYITTFCGTIIQLNLDTHQKIKIGNIRLKLLLVGEALNDGINLLELFDTEEYIYRIGSKIFDFEISDFNKDIHEFYDFNIPVFDLCIIERFEIIENFRGKKIGKLVLENVKRRFSTSCGLFVVHTYPIQFEHPNSDFLLNEKSKMKLDLLDKDFEKSFYKLKAFYQKIGFDHIEGYEDLMFLNPAEIKKC